MRDIRLRSGKCDTVIWHGIKITIINMIKSDSKPPSNEPVCKKIQNYIFKFTDLLGKGNFSKVYKAHHEITSTHMSIPRRNRSHKNNLTKLPKIAKVIRTTLLLNRRAEKTKPSQYPAMLLSFHIESQLLYHH